LGIFEGLRDSYTVTMGEKLVEDRRRRNWLTGSPMGKFKPIREYIPAQIVHIYNRSWWDEGGMATDSSSIEIRFGRYYEGGTVGGGVDGDYIPTEYFRFVRAELTPNNHVLINDKLVDNNSIVETIAEAIIDPLNSRNHH